MSVLGIILLSSGFSAGVSWWIYHYLRKNDETIGDEGEDDNGVLELHKDSDVEVLDVDKLTDVFHIVDNDTFDKEIILDVDKDPASMEILGIKEVGDAGGDVQTVTAPDVEHILDNDQFNDLIILDVDKDPASVEIMGIKEVVDAGGDAQSGKYSNVEDECEIKHDTSNETKIAVNTPVPLPPEKHIGFGSESPWFKDEIEDEAKRDAPRLEKRAKRYPIMGVRMLNIRARQREVAAQSGKSEESNMSMKIVNERNVLSPQPWADFSSDNHGFKDSSDKSSSTKVAVNTEVPLPPQKCIRFGSENLHFNDEIEDEAKPDRPNTDTDLKSISQGKRPSKVKKFFNRINVFKKIFAKKKKRNINTCYHHH